MPAYGLLLRRSDANSCAGCIPAGCIPVDTSRRARDTCRRLGRAVQARPPWCSSFLRAALGVNWRWIG
eukprot:scaffold122577_cov63-Phaeocystis_antarctica.AAC.2